MKAGLIGIGFMGRGHLDQYIRLSYEKSSDDSRENTSENTCDDSRVHLAAICDIDGEKFKGVFTPVESNINVGSKTYDFSPYTLYTDYREMIDKEELDYVDIALPTYLHCEAAIYALEHGTHVLCEKPMALDLDECRRMISAAENSKKTLMVAQCLRFWPAYEYLKECVADGRYGKAFCAYFFRGGATPRWSYENWLLRKDKSGGCLLDQHVHDIDMINYLFGLPKSVFTTAVNVIAGSGWDALSTNYQYDGLVVNAQDDWNLQGGFGFEMIYRVNFEKANLTLNSNGVLTVNPNDGSSFAPDLSSDDGYYREINYFVDCISNNKPIEISTPSSTMDTIRIALCERKSAETGELVNI